MLASDMLSYLLLAFFSLLYITQTYRILYFNLYNDNVNYLDLEIVFPGVSRIVNYFASILVPTITSALHRKYTRL